MSQGWQKCDDPSCGYTTRQVPLTLQRGAPMCTSCFRAHLHPAVSRVTDFCFLIKQFPLLNHCVVHLSKAMNGTLNLKKGFYIIADTLISQKLYAELMFRSCWSKSHLYLFVYILFNSIQTRRCTHSSCITHACSTMSTPSRIPRKK